MSRLRSAVILAAGRGTRMGELTAQLPKPMLPVDGKPILEHIMDRLALAGVERFFVVTGFRHEVIEQHFEGWRLPVEFAIQDPVDGTGSAARLAHGFAASEPFLLTFGDILCDHTVYERCARTLVDHPNTQAVVGVNNVDDPWRGAAVYVNDEWVIHRIIEKPPKGTSTTRWDSAGFYAMQPVAFRYLDRLTPSPRGEYELTQIFELMLQDGLELRISPSAGHWHIGNPEDLDAARRSVPEVADAGEDHRKA